MIEIHSSQGEVVSRSRNMAQLRRAVSKNLVKLVEISGENDRSEGLLRIEFENGNVCVVPFASYQVLKQVISQWRSLYGAPLKVNGQDKGKVENRNEALKLEPIS